MPPPTSKAPKDSTANLGFEAKLWLAADKLRNNMDATEYSRTERDRLSQAAQRVRAAAPINHVVLGLIFLSRAERDRSPKVTRRLSRGLRVKYISDTGGKCRTSNAEVRTRNARLIRHSKFITRNFSTPADARWSHLQANAKQPTIGKTVDDAMVAIERDNPRLKGVLPKDYARPGLDTARRDSALSKREATPQIPSAAKDNHRLGELIDLIATISLTAASEGEKTHRSVDLLGRVYDSSGATKTAAGSPKGERGGAHQYFLTRFASAEGENGGHSSGARKTAKGSPQGERGGVHQFYTPSCVVRCLVEMLAPYKGRIYDPACGSGGMFVQSEKFVESHGGVAKCEVQSASVEVKTLRPFGIRNSSFDISRADIGKEHADTFRSVQHPDLRAGYVLANPPFNDSDWFRKDDDVRWQFGVPPKGNANFAWVQHFIHHLAPGGAGTAGGMAGFVLANGSMSSNQSGEGDIRRALIEADLVDCMVALPGQLFIATDKFNVALAA